MPAIRLPQVVMKSVPTIGHLSNEEFDNLRRSLDESPPAVYPDGLEESIGAVLNEIGPSEVRNLTTAIVSMHRGRISTQSTAADFADAVVSEYRAVVPEGLDEHDVTKLRARVEQILDIAPLALSAQARSVMFEQERMFEDARVLTDVRPIFNLDEITVNSAVVFHVLRIEYHQGNEHKEIHMALDDRDIGVLSEVLKRAQAKSEAVRAKLASAGIGIIQERIAGVV